MPRYPSLISIAELAIGLGGKVHATKITLTLNFFPIRASNSRRQVIVFSRSP